jgi:excisionase family DNA binding protein
MENATEGTADSEPVVLDVPEVARRLGISRSFAYELVAAGEIPSLRLGRRVLVPVHQLRRLLGQAE